MASSRQTVAAPATDHVAFPTHNVPRKEVAHIRAHRDNLADKLVPDCHGDRDRLLCPFIPLIDVDVCPANARIAHPYENVVNPDMWFRNLLEPKTRFAFAFYQCFHDSVSETRVGSKVDLGLNISPKL